MRISASTAICLMPQYHVYSHTNQQLYSQRRWRQLLSKTTNRTRLTVSISVEWENYKIFKTTSASSELSNQPQHTRMQCDQSLRCPHEKKTLDPCKRLASICRFLLCFDPLSVVRAFHPGCSYQCKHSSY